MPRQVHAVPSGRRASGAGRVQTLTLPLTLLAAAPLVAVACAGSGEPETGGARAELHDPHVRRAGLSSGATPKRTRSVAAMMFDISAGPPDPAELRDLLVGPGGSLRHMYDQVSYGLQDLTVELLGPYRLPVANCLTLACCGPSADRTGNGPTVQALIDSLPDRYDHYFWVYGGVPRGASCPTWGDQGNPSKPAVYSSYARHQLVEYAQELGHNLGMTHEAAMLCPGPATFLDDVGACTHLEYGSLISFMGQGSAVAYHPSAYHKFQQGWISGCNVVTVGGAGGRYRLVPQELPCDGVQLLQIPAPRSRPAPAGGRGVLTTYYLELRAPHGFDRLDPQVMISIGGALPDMTSPAPYLYLLDLTPESGTRNHTNAGLMTVGQRYVDPAGGLIITLVELDATAATVVVDGTGTGADTCADATAFTGPGPDGITCGPLTGLLDGGVPSSGNGGAGGLTGSGGVPSWGAGGAAGVGVGVIGRPGGGGCSCRTAAGNARGTPSPLASLWLLWAAMWIERRRTTKRTRPVS